MCPAKLLYMYIIYKSVKTHVYVTYFVTVYQYLFTLNSTICLTVYNQMHSAVFMYLVAKQIFI